MRDKGECEGDPDLPGSSAVCSGPEERREALAGGTTLVQEDGFTQFRLSEASEGLNLGVRRKMGTWVSLGWYMVSPKSCPHPSGVGLARWRGMRVVDWGQTEHSCIGSLKTPAIQGTLSL